MGGRRPSLVTGAIGLGATGGVGVSLGDPLVQFALFILLIWLVPFLFRRLLLPGSVGLLLAGVLLGPDALGLLKESSATEVLGTVGLLYVIFIAGLEIDLDILENRRRETVVFGLLAFGFSLFPALGLGLARGYEVKVAVLMGALLSSHTLLAYPLVSQRGLGGRAAMVTAVSGTVLTDTLALVLFTIVTSARGGWPPWWFWVRLTGFVAVYTIAVGWSMPRLGYTFLSRLETRPAQRVLFVLAALFTTSVLAQLIGLEAILGAFLVGLTLNRVLHHHEHVMHEVRFIGEAVFVPFFFVTTGMLLDVNVIVSDGRAWILALLMSGVVVGAKFAACWTTGALFEFPKRDRVLMAGLTIPQAAATLAIAMTAREEGLFDEPLLNAVIIMILITCIGGPIWVKLAASGLKQNLQEVEKSAHEDTGATHSVS